MRAHNDPELLSFLKSFTSEGDSGTYPLLGIEGPKTLIESLQLEGSNFFRFVNEFWTSKQRQAASIHEISYRACFKPQLPRFFVQLLSNEGERVYDPFSGRGTTVIEAGILGRNIISNDANPLSEILTRPRLSPPNDQVSLQERLFKIPLHNKSHNDLDLSMFFHRKTLNEILSLRNYLFERRCAGSEDDMDRWIRMVATNRLTGHSSGFFSVYTLPPNQALSPQNQIKINTRLNQVPEYRDTKQIILKKTKSLLRNLKKLECDNLRLAGRRGRFLVKDASDTPEIESNSVQLIVTSPPFLNIVQYREDNWLRCWFNELDAQRIASRITMAGTVQSWNRKMQYVFQELFRVTKPGGWVAFEVGEVRNGTINLDEYVVPLGEKAGFICFGVIVNLQEFTKTSQIWGVKNNRSGTNTNRIALFQKAS